MTACTELEPLIAERASGPLDPSDAARLDAHLAGCAHCRDELAAWKETFGLARLPAPSVAERLAVVAQLPAQVRAELRRGRE
ncbi:MAG: zf-HC2 domain-containing protein, partial [Anaeromyxobacteraceae bacterium]